MCYHTRIAEKAKRLEEHYKVTRSANSDVGEDELLYYHGNGFDHKPFWVIPQERKDKMTPMLWGFLPYNKLGETHKTYYAESIRYGAGLNAQSEKLFTNNLYKKSALTRRCIVPLSGFFEPHTCETPKNYKVPFYFHQKNAPFVSLAGIYSITPDKYVSFALLTKEAPPESKYAQIHNKRNWEGQHRQVIPLKENQLNPWLSNTLTETGIMDILGNELPESELNAYPISKDLFSRTKDSNHLGIIDLVEHRQLKLDYTKL